MIYCYSGSPSLSSSSGSQGDEEVTDQHSNRDFDKVVKGIKHNTIRLVCFRGAQARGRQLKLVAEAMKVNTTVVPMDLSNSKCISNLILFKHTYQLCFQDKPCSRHLPMQRLVSTQDSCHIKVQKLRFLNRVFHSFCRSVGFFFVSSNPQLCRKSCRGKGFFSNS